MDTIKLFYTMHLFISRNSYGVMYGHEANSYILMMGMVVCNSPLSKLMLRQIASFRGTRNLFVNRKNKFLKVVCNLWFCFSRGVMSRCDIGEMSSIIYINSIIGL